MKTDVNSITKTRKRFLKNTMIWTIGFIITLLSWSQASEAPMLTVTQIEDVPNLYFDNMGVTRVYHRQWRILYTYDLMNLGAIEKAVYKCFSTFCQSLDKTKLKGYIEIVYYLYIRYIGAREVQNRILHSIGLFDENRQRNDSLNPLEDLAIILLGTLDSKDAEYRQRNDSLNPVEDLANILFGTLDSKDAEYYNSEIDKLYNNIHVTLETNIDKETTVVKGVFKDLTNYKDKVQTTAEQFNENITEDNQQVYKLRKLLTLSEIITEYSELMVKLKGLISNGIQGKLNPTMLDQVNLLTILKEMESKFGPERMFYPAKGDTVFHYPKIIKLNIFTLQRSKLCFELLLPILESEIYSLYQLVPVPLVQDKLMYFVSTTERFILLDNSTKYYNPVKISHINNCVIVDKIRLCELDTQMSASAYQDPCIARAIRQLPEEDNCPKTVAKIFNPIWIELYSKQTWISITHEPESLNITCQNLQNETEIIEGINIISIAPECVGNTHSATLLPTRLKSDITIHPKVPLGMTNVTIQTLDDTSLIYAKIPEFYESIISPEHFSSHSKSLSEITEEISMHVEATTQSETNWSNLDIIEVGIGILSMFYYIFYKLWKIFKCCKCCNCCCNCCTCCCKQTSNEQNTNAERTVRFSNTNSNQPTSTLDDINGKPVILIYNPNLTHP